jgi:hypothetical protein
VNTIISQKSNTAAKKPDRTGKTHVWQPSLICIGHIHVLQKGRHAPQVRRDRQNTTFDILYWNFMSKQSRVIGILREVKNKVSDLILLCFYAKWFDLDRKICNLFDTHAFICLSPFLALKGFHSRLI